ncbi:ribosomal protein S2, flavodoxin-like domain-containing protein [Aspergillus unguis]
MILRQSCVRQSRQLLGLNRQAYNISRFQSTQTDTRSPAELLGHAPIREPGSGAVTMPKPSRKVQPRTTFKSLGSRLVKTHQPDKLITNPPSPSDITLEFLLASQTHLGHSTSRWNPQNSRYIFGIRDGIHIISLDITAAHLRRAAKVVEEVAARGGLILFAGTRPGQKDIVVRAAELSKSYHLFERWIPGSLTNGEQILGHCAQKVVNELDQEIPDPRDPEKKPTLKPDLVVCLNPLENEPLLHECGLNGVPTIGVIDTDADPTRVTYAIPANDDSLRSVGLICGVLGRAGEAGQKRRLEKAGQKKQVKAGPQEQHVREPHFQ